MWEYLEGSQTHGLVAVDAAGRIRVVNGAALKTLGWQRGEVLGKKLTEVVHWPELAEALSSGRYAYGVRTILGDTVIIADYFPWPDGEGGRGAAALFHDISLQERSSSERDYFRQLYREMQAVIDSSYDGFLITDGEGVILQVNKAYERIRGLKAEQVVGKSFDQLIAEGVYTYSVVDSVRRERDRVSVILSPKDNHLLFTATPIFDEEGNIYRIVINVRDMTELTKLRYELQHAKELSERYRSELNELRAQQALDDGIVAYSPAMRNTLDLALRVAGVDSTVLITGETGVGKEVVARLVHNSSSRRGEAFIRVNCGAIPETLLESELFGYEPGAFTGASKGGKPGLFELADRGTLFLDEVGDLALSLQAKILRAIQEREIIRVGGIKPRKVNVRIIAATNRDLEKMVREGKFREDLYFRLNVVPIHVPPLRERPEDIIPLTYHFRDIFNRRYGLKREFAPEVLEAFLEYSWPGNVRELENMVERLIVTASQDLITTASLPVQLRQRRKDAQISVSGIVPLKQAVEEVEKQVILEALARYKSPDKVAQVLGVNRATIFRKLKKIKGR